MAVYKCLHCGRVYEEKAKPLDNQCIKPLCWGVPPLASVDTTEIGLCLFVCDVGFANMEGISPNRSTKILLVANSMAKSIVRRYWMQHYERAVIGIICFGERAGFVPDSSGRPFLKTIRIIRELFPRMEALGDYLESALTREAETAVGHRFSDLELGLRFAHETYRSVVEKSGYLFPGLPSQYNVEQWSLPDIGTFPNSRLLLYSDGGHHSSTGSIKNPFALTHPTPVIVVHVGATIPRKEGRTDTNLLKALACTFPIHGSLGYFQLDEEQPQEDLLRLFRIQNLGGWCPACVQHR